MQNCQGSCSYVIHTDSSNINFMCNSSFKQFEAFSYSILAETCCPELRFHVDVSVFVVREPTVPFPSKDFCLYMV